MSTFSQGVKEKFAVSSFTLSLNLNPLIVNFISIYTPLKEIIYCAICTFVDIFKLQYCNVYSDVKNHPQSVLPASVSKNPEQNKLRLLVCN